MSREQALAMVKARVEQAGETLRDAQALADGGGSARSVINRAYYAMFYAALALLQTVGEAPSKHTGVIGLFDQHFYRKGLFSKEHSQAFHELFELRQFSDYRSLTPVSGDEALEALAKARGFLAGVAGLITTSQFQAADPNAGGGMELQAIAAVVIGGTSLMGGRGSVVNSFFGVLIIAVLGTGLTQMGAGEPTKRLITGLVIVAAVIVDHYRGRLTGT